MSLERAWMEDIPQQFKSKPNIEVLISAFSKQMEELLVALKQIVDETTLQDAVGKNLDNVGNIMNMTRKDAAMVFMSRDIEEITDEIYRKALQYKTKKNNTGGTYYDIIESMRLIWDDAKVEYKENPSRPATINLDFPEVSLDASDPAINRVLTVKPAGVQVIYRSAFSQVFMLLAYEKFIYKNAQLGMTIMFPFYFYSQPDVKRLDGTWSLDGSVLLGGPRKDRVPARMTLRTMVHTPVNMLNYEPRLDGSFLLDGQINLSGVPTQLDMFIRAELPKYDRYGFYCNGEIIE